ncbi:glycoside hydrolase family 3 C-terminal domain-containing protein [Falcatimonas sp. MSJ-15]|uniref:glycoside hydrolase family 3 protein n=1 Tax=Falcatimonas sp. MSJ-15 TaxID=2841515 RepID=UPI001C0F7CC6|nr:glycoside hydrolase family 3 protein [Falcatimonas sp. MSJ-15]MBU5471217.1 glycoside hydrolase family 3 C-terminal domain-containing protein [Falcatimonas sp. MSJ-15]
MVRKEYTGTINKRMSECEIKNDKIAYEISKECIVLLKNDGILPLDKNEKLALLGCGADRTVKGGIGSGDVNNRYNISIYKGMKDKGFNIISEAWIKDYDVIYDNARKEWKDTVLSEAKKVNNPFDAYAENPFGMPDGRIITEEDIQGIDKALYVISRISGEGRDRRKERGDYYLSKKEEEDIKFLDSHNVKIILVINSGGPVEITDIIDITQNISAVLYMSQLGQQGGNAVADILSGEINPSGRLTSTWGRRYNDYPGAATFGYLDGNVTEDTYDEGIFVGYRYFDKMHITPLYPFGFGLSYTEFDIQFIDMKHTDETMQLKFKVTNIGNRYSGKEVIQVYAKLPSYGEEKEEKRLVAYAKTDELKCNESQYIVVAFTEKELASYDERQKIWYIQNGNYEIYVGNSSDSLDKIFTLQKDYEIIEDISKCHNEVQQVKSEIINEIPAEELVDLLYGYVSDNAGTLGASGIRVPGSAGETTSKYQKEYGIQPLIMADGPAGIRLHMQYEVDRISGDVYGKSVLGALENGYLEPFEQHDNTDVYYQYCTAFPVGVAIAQTWNRELQEAFGKAVATEMQTFGIHLWLAPGMNIQRNPLCGRNFEYYSEDPYLTGETALAVVKGVQSKHGCGATIKHFACNNQEDSRMEVNVNVSERALREIYLRGFEIVVKKGSPKAVMTSYNLINGEHTANSRWLCNDILRKEWQFDGVVMSDWNTTIPDNGSKSYICIKAGNDLIMPGNIKDKEDILKAYRAGKLSEEEIKRSAGRIIKLTYELTEKYENL